MSTPKSQENQPAAGESGQVMPAAFFGHGNPMNALSEDRYTAAWRAFGQSVCLLLRAPDS